MHSGAFWRARCCTLGETGMKLRGLAKRSIMDSTRYCNSNVTSLIETHKITDSKHAGYADIVGNIYLETTGQTHWTSLNKLHKQEDWYYSTEQNNTLTTNIQMQNWKNRVSHVS